MARSRITSTSKDIITDDGAVLISVIQGEQIRLELTLNWLTNLTDFDIAVKVVEADMTELNRRGRPIQVQTGGVTTSLTVVDPETTDNKFQVVIPKTLSDAWTTQPTPDSPVYGFFGFRIADPGVGDEQQVFKFMRGLVEVLYSPSGEG